ncbi:hypothetical protein PV327_002345 [Microctonus hyperodae]|uniref:CWF19-like protein 2 n=1 Tax=Microctonus hyperodae TaxID=165561 RepID=A0AA39FFT2_MICHY|nr:hypothetical protein PV327_002345 [Microctonus hyperodae]
MSYIQFESAREKDAQREAVRKARERILVDAEEKYRRKEAQEEQARLRGDDKWMLPSVDAKLSKDKSKKKKKKEKKEKKVKKSKKKKKRSSTSSSSSDTSDDEEMQWVEKKNEDLNKSSPLVSSNNIESEKPLQREEWMSLSGSFSCSSRDKKSKKDNDMNRDTCIMDKPGTSSRELNPHWKNNGTGMPEEEEGLVKKSTAQVMSVDWLKKSLRRAQEQALEEGRSLEEIAEERWGSLDVIKSQIAEAEKQSRNSNTSRRNFYDDSLSNSRRSDYKRSYRDRSRSRSRSRDRSNRNYDRYKYDISNKNKIAFRKPDEENHLASSYSRPSSSSVKSWRKPEANEKITNQQEQSRILKSQQEKKQAKSDNESSGTEEELTTVPTKILTDDELNKLGARIVKAEIMGDNALAKELKAEMEKARETRKNNPKPVESKRESEKNVILTTTNSRGLARPVQPRSRYEEPQGGRRRNKKTDTHEAGERVRYFADDDKFSLQEMFQREKGQSANDDDAMFVKMASKSMDMDELFEERITRGESDAKQDRRDKMRAIKEHQKMQKSLDNCRWCVDSNEMQKHLIVAMGSKVYLSLPWHVSLTSGHCIIAPIHHVSCQTQLDEDVWEEITAFKKALTKMFMDNNECPVFFEIAMSQYRFPHMQLECIALPEDVGSMAPMYFKKALLECETEWSTNKKIVDLNHRNVRQVIPKGLPYFAVNFGNHGGFAHVIEDEKMFPRNFAQEIIGGMLDLDSNMWRKPPRENFDRQKQKVLSFADKWKNYDITSNNSD